LFMSTTSTSLPQGEQMANESTVVPQHFDEVIASILNPEHYAVWAGLLFQE